ncbi:MAG: immune inhibitor A [Anaerolineae bacterium]|nr:immune inhibitor A [Anaerolineae bacterium]
MSTTNRNLIILLVTLVILACCCLAAVCLMTSLLVSCQPPTPTAIPTPTRTPTPSETGGQGDKETRGQEEGLPLSPSPPLVTDTPAPTPTAKAMATPAPSTEEHLAQAVLPTRDLRDLALRLRHHAGEIPVVVNATPPHYEVGDVETFWLGNVDTEEHFQIEAELLVKLPHVYMWVEKGVDVDLDDLERSARRFEERTYPTNRAFFGSEWSPGVDNDVHLTILNATNLGDSVAGYFSSADEFSRLANPYSNEREIFYINLENNPPGTAFYDGTLAHEFQHMIHWANDRNEETWVNEGLSELATELNGFSRGGADVVFSQEPDTQLTTWTDDPELNAYHYGNAYLFMSYFLDRFGEELTQAVVASPANGPAGFDEALAAAGYDLRFDDVFADWVIANLLDRPRLEDGRYGYERDNPRPVALEARYRSYPVSERTTVHQYAADYFELSGRGDVVIDFCGATETRLAATAAHSGRFAWWAHRADDSDTRLTHAFDLSEVSQATLEFWLWYDLEEGYDYGYVEVSTDGGATWHILEGEHSSDYNPVGNAFGVGYTGKSGAQNPKTKIQTPTSAEAEWVKERMDLSPYVGQEVLVRFEYVTDDAVNYPGWFVDDIAIPALGFFDDGESGEGDWQTEGWVLTDGRLPQRWLVQVIEQGLLSLSVQRMTIDDTGCGQLPIKGLGQTGRKAVLVVSALAPVTTEEASYTFEIRPPSAVPDSKASPLRFTQGKL